MLTDLLVFSILLILVNTEFLNSEIPENYNDLSSFDSYFDRSLVHCIKDPAASCWSDYKNADGERSWICCMLSYSD